MTIFHIQPNIRPIFVFNPYIHRSRGSGPGLKRVGGGSNLAMSSLSLPPGHDDAGGDCDDDDGYDDDVDDDGYDDDAGRWPYFPYCSHQVTEMKILLIIYTNNIPIIYTNLPFPFREAQCF